LERLTDGQRGHLAMLVFSALVAGSFTLGTRVANEIAPLALTAVRFLIAGVVIGVMAHVMGRFKPAHLQGLWRYGVLGGLLSAYFVLMFYGLQTAPPVSAAAVFTLTPVISGVIGWLFLRQVTTRWMALALTVGGFGAVIVIFRADWQLMRAFDIGRGEALYFIGCVAHAIYTPFVRLLNRGEPAIVSTFGVLVAGTVILTVVGWGDIQATPWMDLPVMVWVVILYLALFTSGMTFVLLQYAALRLPSAKVMAYTYLVPSWVILWELAFGGALPGGLVFVGIVLTGIALLMLLETKSERAV